MKLKILSWNIWIDCNFEQVKDFLKSSNTDVIGLQEVLDNDSKRDVIGFLKGLGYEHAFAPIKKVWKGQTWSDGPALFSKFKMTNVQKYELSTKDTRAAVSADIGVEGKILHIFSTHLIHTHQKQMDVQDEQAQNLIKLLPNEHTIVMGDFNATPESPVVKNMRNILVDSDLTGTPTWSNYPKGCETCNPSGLDIRLDYIFTSKDIKIISSKVESSPASDHLPISAVIEL